MEMRDEISIKGYLMSKLKSSLLWWVGLIGVLLCIPLLLRLFPPYYTQLATEILIMILFATSFNLLFGYAGLLSFGQSAFFGTGAYAAAMILRGTTSLPLALVGGTLISTFLAVVIGYFCVKRVALYFAMLTLAFAQLIYVIVFKWYGLTGGSDGIIVPRIPYLAKPINFYYFTLGIVIISIFILRKIVNSPFGHVLQAIRENSERANYVGVVVRRHLLVSFIVAGLFSGLAGAIFAPFVGIVTPEVAHWTTALKPVIMVVLGGASYFWGPTVGAILFMVLKDIITLFTEYWLIYLGGILLIIVLFSPKGISGLFQRIVNSANFSFIRPFIKKT